MINYSISLRANPSDQDAPKKAYANAQYSEIMTLDKFAEHISTHGSKYNRADIQAVLIQAVDCMREQLLDDGLAHGFGIISHRNFLRLISQGRVYRPEMLS